MTGTPKNGKTKAEEKVEVYRTQSYQDLFDAIGMGDEEKITEILQTTSNPQELLRKKDLQGLTPLKKAVALAKAEIARILVSFGAEPSVRDPLGRTALHVAAMQGRRELIAPLLVSKDSSVNVQDNEGWTPLHLAVRGQHEKAINWLLYAGADVNLKNKGLKKMAAVTRSEADTMMCLSIITASATSLQFQGNAEGRLSKVITKDETPVDMSEEDSPIRQMLQRQAYNLDDCPVELCSAFIGRKQLNMIGPNGYLMFVTSGLWSNDMQFIFNVRIRPYYAMPPIPLRQDEMFFGDVCCYRMMYKLPPGQNRVQAYFLLFEHFLSSQLILKITSKSKCLGEVPVSLSTYTQDNFTCFLASTEIELKDAGQFVLVKRPTPVLLTKGLDGVYSHTKFPMFKFDLPQGTLPGPPHDWEATRRDRAWAENEAMIQELMKQTEMETNGPAETEENENTNADQQPETHDAEDAAGKGEGGGEDGEGEGGAGDGEDEEAEAPPPRPEILNGDEPDDCDDFYYISQGWGLHLECRITLPLNLLLDKNVQERNFIACSTNFYRVSHSSRQHPTKKCRIQIPKTEAFVKVGTVLVLMRTELGPGETEFPDPDDQADEHFLSSDGKNVWGAYWLAREKERWSLLPSGIVNKKTRVIFETNKLTTFVVVQLKTGTQKWEAESDDESSSEEEPEAQEAAEAVKDKAEGEEGEAGGEEEQRKSVSQRLSSAVPPESEEPVAPAKRRRRRKSRKSIKRRRTIQMKEDYGDDDDSTDENVQPSGEEEGVAEGDDEKSRGELASGAVPAAAGEESAGRGVETTTPQPRSAEAGAAERPEAERKDENASNINRSSLNENDNYGNGPYNVNNSATERPENEEKANINTNQKLDEEDDDEESLAPEERTVVKNLEPARSSYAVVVGIAAKPKKPLSPQAEEPVQEEEAPEVTEEEEEEKVEDKESDEDLPEIRERVLSIASWVDGKTVLQDFRFGPPLTDMAMAESDESFLKQSVALMWRYRNHRESAAVVFSRARDSGFDMIIEIVRVQDLYVRAEHWWSKDYKMVAESLTFPFKSGRLFSFALEGTLVVESPPGSTPGYIVTRNLYCYLSQINSLEYFVKRGVSSKEDEKGQKKGPKKKEDVKAETSEPDAMLEITGYPRGTRTNGVDVTLMPIMINGPDLWYDRHVQLRKPDNILLSRLVKYLRKDKELVKRWWKLIIMLGFPEKEVENEKGKSKSSIIVATFLKKWFDDNLNSRDRGILALVNILYTMELESTIEGMVVIIKQYKAHLLNVKQRPRYLKLLFHWVIETKITRNSLVKMLGPQILKPLSDIFLLRLSELLNPALLYKIGACMDIEDNVIHAIAEEDVITDPEYLPFRVFIKSRQKKDEIIHYTLLLMNMCKQCEEPEGKNFVVNEMRKWMETVADTEHEICAKLDNIFG